MEQELTALQRAPQAALEPHALEAALIHFWREELVEVAALLPRPVHRQLGILDQGMRIATVGIEDRYAGSRRDKRLAIVEVEWLREGMQHPLHYRGHLLHLVDVGQGYRELVRAQPADAVIGADTGDQSLGDLYQHPVAGGMTVSVVDQFEAIEIERHDGDRAALTHGTGDRLGDAVAKQLPVGKPGQGVELRCIGELLIGPAPRQRSADYVGDTLHEVGDFGGHPPRRGTTDFEQAVRPLRPRYQGRHAATRVGPIRSRSNVHTGQQAHAAMREFQHAAIFEAQRLIDQPDGIFHERVRVRIGQGPLPQIGNQLLPMLAFQRLLFRNTEPALTATLLEERDCQAREALERESLGRREAPGPIVFDTKCAQPKPTGVAQGDASVKADLRVRYDEGIVQKPGVLEHVRNLQHLAAQNGVGAEGDVARCLTDVRQPVIGLEPLPLPVDETEQRNRSITDLGRQRGNAVEQRIARRVENVTLVEGQLALAFIVRQGCARHRFGSVERPFNEGRSGRES